MSNEELQTVVEAVIHSLKTNGKTIDQLTAVQTLLDGDCFEIGGGRKISYEVLVGLLSEAIGIDTSGIYTDIAKTVLQSVTISADGTTATLSIKQAGYDAKTVSIPVATSEQSGIITVADRTKYESAYSTANSALSKANAQKTRIEDLEDAVFNITDYDKNDLTADKYWHLGGTTVPTTMSPSSSGTACGSFEVKAGNVVVVATKGGTSAVRAYALADTSRNILTVAESGVDTTSNPVTLTVESDGYLFVNCLSDGLNDFAVTLYQSKVKDIEDRLDDIDDEIEDINDEIDDIKDTLQVTEDYDKNDLTANKYYNLGHETAPATPANSSTGTHCFRTTVEAGDVVRICVKSGASEARAWALTDSELTILSRSDTNIDTRSNPVSVNVTQDGYVYSNSASDGVDDFSITIFKNQTIVAEVEALGNEVEALGNEVGVPRYHNNPLPIGKSTLKILAIGNSFTADSLSYLADMVSAAGISASNLCVYGVVKGGSSMDTFVSIYDSGTSLATNGATCTRSVGSIDMSISDSNTLAQVLAKDWDIVVLNQYSQHAYSQVNPSLTKLIFHIRENCTNQAVAIAWHGVWSYQSDKSGYPGGSEAQWADLQKVTKMQMTQDGVDIIIPTGTAIQNARNTSLVGDSDGELTRDGAHMAFGVGRYIVAATWFQTLLAPIFGVSILGNTCVHDTLYSAEVAYDEALQEAHEEDPVNNMYFPPIYVTTSNRELCQLCAMWATIDKWTIHVDNN